jgi:hypothetical protein
MSAKMDLHNTHHHHPLAKTFTSVPGHYLDYKLSLSPTEDSSRQNIIPITPLPVSPSLIPTVKVT